MKDELVGISLKAEWEGVTRRITAQEFATVFRL
jgi:hypothetical protein